MGGRRRMHLASHSRQLAGEGEGPPRNGRGWCRSPPAAAAGRGAREAAGQRGKSLSSLSDDSLYSRFGARLVLEDLVEARVPAVVGGRVVARPAAAAIQPAARCRQCPLLPQRLLLLLLLPLAGRRPPPPPPPTPSLPSQQGTAAPAPLFTHLTDRRTSTSRSTRGWRGRGAARAGLAKAASMDCTACAARRDAPRRSNPGPEAPCLPILVEKRAGAGAHLVET